MNTERIAKKMRQKTIVRKRMVGCRMLGDSCVPDGILQALRRQSDCRRADDRSNGAKSNPEGTIL